MEENSKNENKQKTVTEKIGKKEQVYKNPTSHADKQIQQEFDANKQDDNIDNKMIFKAREGITDFGRDYEKLMVIHFIIDFMNDEHITNFAISSNDTQFGAFDDVVIEFTENQTLKKYALQLKHSENKSNLDTNKFSSNEKGSYSIKKYFQSYKENKDTLKDYHLMIATNLKCNVSNSGNKIKLNLNGSTVTIELAPNTNLERFQQNCYKFTICASQNLENLDNDFRDFLNKFHVVTNQPNVDEIKNKLREQMSKIYNENLFDKTLKFVTNWTNQKGYKTKLYKMMLQEVFALFLLEDSIEPITFQTVASNAKILQNEIANFTVTTFSKQSLDSVKKLWGDAQINLTNPKDLKKLNKKYQILQEGKDIKSDERLDPLEQTKFLWLTNDCPLIIHETHSTYKVIKLCETKKFVVVGKESVGKNLEVFSTLADLKNIGMESDLYQNFKCLVPHEINLSDLVKEYPDVKPLISTDILLKMIEGPYALQQENEPFSTIYIDRVLSKTLIDIKFLESLDDKAFVVISGIDNNLSHHPYLAQFKIEWLNINNLPQKSNNEPSTLNSTVVKKLTIYLHGTLEMSPKTFEDVCSKIQGMTKFHHFRIFQDGKMLEWISSKSDISELQQYRNETILSSQSDFIYNNVNILTGDPGMGKSWFLKNLKKQLSSKNITVLLLAVDMNKICDYIKNNPKQSFVDFLIKHKYKHSNEFERFLLKKLMHDDKVVFLWDALDEINSDESIKQITDCIYRFAKNNSFHWISCRRHLQATLEKKFNVLSNILREFNNEEQNRYINERLNLNNIYTKEEILKITINIQEHVAFIKFKDILSIPLQIYMLTEILLNDKENFNLVRQSFSIINIYEHFVDGKFKILFKEKVGLDSTNETNINLLLKEFKIPKTQLYKKAALALIFDENIVKQLNIDLKELEEKCVDDASGFLIPTDSTNKNFQFIHVSYAEYFAACYLVEHRSEMLKSFLFQERYNNVRFFFDMLLAKESPAHQAVLCKNLQALRNCKNEDVLKRDLAGRNVLQIACSWGERYPLLTFRKENDKYILKEDFYGLEATKLNFEFMQIIEHLLNFRFSDTQDCFNMNVFEYAQICNCWFTICLIDKKLKTLYLKQPANKIASISILFYAILVGYDKIDNVLQHYDIVSSVETQNQSTLLYLASENGNYAISKLLVDKGANVNAANQHGFTALYAASQNNHIEVVRLLIRKGANVNATDKDGFTCLYVAIAFGHHKVGELLIDNGVNIDAVDKNGYTALFAAVQNGYEKSVKLLVDKGANVNLVHKDGFSVLQVAFAFGHVKVMELLIDRGANVDEIFYAALKNGNDKMVNLLIDKGANLNRRYKNGFTALHVASYYGYEKIVELLISNGAEVNAVDTYGKTALDIAVHKKHYEVINKLVSKM